MAQLTLDQVLRLDIIKLLGADAQADRAKKLYEFVMGDTAQGVLPLTEPKASVEYPPVDTKDAGPPNDPGVKRTRRTKAEIEVAVAKTVDLTNQGEASSAAPDALKAGIPTAEEAAPKIPDYKEVQMAVLNLIQNKEGGKELVIGVLEQFGIPTALQLKPEQYEEALELFTAAFNA